MTWFVGDDYQIAEWGRVYSIFQEGPPLGETSNARGMGAGWPHQMYNRVGTDDLDLIQAWADATIELAKIEKKIEKMLEEALEEAE